MYSAYSQIQGREQVNAVSRKKTAFLVIGILLLALFAAAALFPSILTPYGQKEMFDAWLEPSAEHPLGTNSLGYDIFAELVHGAGDTLSVGLVSSILTMILGSLIGVLAAQKGAAGALFSGLINIFMLLPRLISLIVLSAFLGQSRVSLIMLIATFSWVGTARTIRAQVQHIYTQPFIENCRVCGYSRAHTAFAHVLPNLSDILLSRFLLGVNGCIMMESTLSFLGFGDLYHPSWGTMVNFAYRRGAFMRGAWNYLLPPGVCIMLLSLAFYFISVYFESSKEEIKI